MLASAREARAVLANPRPVLAILFLGVALLTLLGVFLALPGGLVSPSGITLLLAVPFCLWVAMQPRSLDGAAVSFLAAHVALYVILRQTGSVVRADYVTTVLYLNIVIATCQLVHAVNRDRLSALEAIAAHKAELEARVVERTARLEQMTERAIAADKAKTKFLATVSHEVRTPLNGVIGMASVVLAADLDADTRRNVAMIRSSGLHLLDVINRILDYFRLDQAPTAHDDVELRPRRARRGGGRRGSLLRPRRRHRAPDRPSILLCSHAATATARVCARSSLISSETPRSSPSVAR